MNIRDMEKDDVTNVIAVIAKTSKHDASVASRYYRSLYDKNGKRYEDEEAHDFVAVNEDDLVVGIGGIQPDEDGGEDIWWLSWWYIDPEYQHQGIGNTLMEKAISLARENEGRKLYVDVSKLDSYGNARQFYGKHGFVKETVFKDFYSVGEDMIIMAKTL